MFQVNIMDGDEYWKTNTKATILCVEITIEAFVTSLTLMDFFNTWIDMILVNS